jgi:hypothetical protein
MGMQLYRKSGQQAAKYEGKSSISCSNTWMLGASPLLKDMEDEVHTNSVYGLVGARRALQQRHVVTTGSTMHGPNYNFDCTGNIIIFRYLESTCGLLHSS